MNPQKIKILRSKLLNKFPEVVFGISTKPGGVSPDPYCLNLSISVGDEIENVKANRKLFFDELGITKELVTFQKQIHSTNINYSGHPQHFLDSDAIYTDRKNNFLAVSVADCIPVLLYEPDKKIVAAIHSGWKGSANKIVSLTIDEIQGKMGAETESLVAFIGPGISQKNYEVGDDVGKFFDDEVKIHKNGKFYLDLKKNIYRELVSKGLKESNIEVCDLCTFEEKELLHSYRRDKEKSGRMFGIIGIRT